MLSTKAEEHVKGSIQLIYDCYTAGVRIYTVRKILVIKALNDVEIKIFKGGFLDILRFPPLKETPD